MKLKKTALLATLLLLSRATQTVVGMIEPDEPEQEKRLTEKIRELKEAAQTVKAEELEKERDQAVLHPYDLITDLIAVIIAAGDKGKDLDKVTSDALKGIITEYLEKDPKTINLQDREHKTALHHVATGRNGQTSLEILNLLIQKGAQPNIKSNRYPHYPLLVAVKSNFEGGVDALLQAGADVNAQTPPGYPTQLAETGKQTALMIAAKMGNKPIAQKLLDHSDIKLNLKDFGGRTALEYAEDRPEIARLIKQKQKKIAASEGAWEKLKRRFKPKFASEK